MDTLTNQTIKGYAIQDHIGQGAFGVVYRAYQPIIDREVAIKVILPQYANQPDFIRRFEMEAQVVARLEHLHIVPLYDYWRDPDGAYLVMRYLRGGSLKEWIAQGALDPGDALRLVEQIAAALAVAHRHGVVHRDIKPSNILLDEERNAYLADFGIAKVLGHESSMDGLRGTLDYVSPEQIRSQPVTAQTDIYALGIVLYEMLAGEQPFSPASSPAELLQKHLETPLPDVRSARSELPGTVNDVVQIATAKAPAERYPDAPGLAHALREALAAAELAPAVTEHPLVEPLTDRELEVLHLLAEGLSNNEIASQLVIALSTVKWYVQQVYGKLGVGNRRQAIAAGQRLGLLEGAARRDVALPDWLVGHNPYKGLAAFQQADAADFFGREALVEQLVARLQNQGDMAHFLAVVGPSGSGKSSVVRAGLLPALNRGAVPGSENWFVIDMLPGARPLDQLEVVLGRIATQHLPGLREQLQRDAYGLLRVADLVLPEEGQLLLVIDQFEELFTLVDDPKVIRHVLDLIYAAVTDSRSRVRVIVTLRADFYDRPLMYPDFVRLMNHRTEAVGPLTPEELEQAIVKPAELAGVTVEPGLVAALVADVHEQPGTLPLLEYALTELFDRRQGRTMTLAAYQALGGALGALTRQADEVYDDLSGVEQDAARQGFLRLVTLGEGTEDVRRRVLLSELTAISASRDGMGDVLDLFGSYRLLTFDCDPATREPTVEVAHEALIQRWERLRGWIDSSRADIRQQRLLAAAANEWEQAGRDKSYLLTGSRLAQFEDWAARTDLALTPGEREFVDASVAEHQRQRVRRRRVRYGVMVASATIALIMMVLALVALNREQRAQDAREEAQQERDKAQELALVNGAQAALNKGDLDTALALAVAANRHERPSAEAQLVLAEAAYSPGTRKVLPQYYAYQSALSQDGRLLLTAAKWTLGEPNPIHLWDTTTWELLRTFEGNYQAIWALTFSPDARWFISSGEDLTLRLWDVQSGVEVRRFEFPTVADYVQKMVFSSDGSRVYACSGTYLVEWDTATGQITRTMLGDENTLLLAIDLHPDGKRALTTSWDGTWLLWDLTTGTPLHHFGKNGEAHTDWATGCFLDPHRAVTVSLDGKIILWDVDTYEDIRHFDVPTGTIPLNLTCRPDGKQILTDNSTVNLWDVETGREIPLLEGVQVLANEAPAQFVPNAQQILFARDNAFRVWDLQVGAELMRFEPRPDPAWWMSHLQPVPGTSLIIAWNSVKRGGANQGGPLIMFDMTTGEEVRRFDPGFAAGDWNDVSCTTVSHDGRLLAAGSYTGQIIIWDIATGQQLSTLAGHTGESWSLVFSPDDRILVSASADSTLIVWDPTTGQVIRRLIGHDDLTLGNLAISADGHLLVSGSENEMIVWDLITGDIIRRLNGGTSWGLAISPDGQHLLSSAADGVTILWDLATGQPLHTLSDSASGIAATFDPSGQYALVAGKEYVFQWEVETGGLVRRYPAPNYGYLLNFSADGRSFVVEEKTQNAAEEAPGTFARRLVQYRFDSPDELLTWVHENRYIRELTCAERATYHLEPGCDAEGIYPTSTPYIAPPPSPTPFPTQVPEAGPTATDTPTAAPIPILIAHLGDNRGDVAIGAYQQWHYTGRAGEIIRVSVTADQPCNGAVDDLTCLDTQVSVIAPQGELLTWDWMTGTPNQGTNDIEPQVNSNSQVSDLVLSYDGDYTIEVSGYYFKTGGAYTLTIESQVPEESTPTPSP